MLKRVIVFATTLLVWSASVVAQENTVKRLPEVKESSKSEFAEFSSYDKGFWAAAELVGSYSCRVNKSNIPATELDVVGGYRFGEYLRLGLGLGVRYYINNSHMRAKDLKVSAPFFLNVRGNFMSAAFRTVVPFYSFDLGTSFGDGVMVRPSIGLRIGEKRSAFTIAIGYTAQRLGVYNDKYDVNSAEPQKLCKKEMVSFVNLKLGYEF